MNQKNIEQTLTALKKNNFGAYLASNPQDAREIVFTEIIPAITPGIVSYGDSMTLQETGILDRMRTDPAWEFLDTFEQGVPRAEILERRRQALLADLFFTGSNAVTMDGKLINLDMVGNRVGGIVWGPHHVVITIGSNKIVENMSAAMDRVREVAAPANAKRHKSRTPCVKTGKCMDCKSPDRICNVWTITEKSWPAKRISVILINGAYGL